MTLLLPWTSPVPAAGERPPAMPHTRSSRYFAPPDDSNAKANLALTAPFTNDAVQAPRTDGAWQISSWTSKSVLSDVDICVLSNRCLGAQAALARPDTAATRAASVEPATTTLQLACTSAGGHAWHRVASIDGCALTDLPPLSPARMIPISLAAPCNGNPGSSTQIMQQQTSHP